MNDLTVATVSFCSKDKKAENVAKAESFIKLAKARGADWVLLPEVFTYFGSYSALDENSESADGSLVEKLSQLAKDESICILAGSFGETITDRQEEVSNDKGNKKVYNTLFVFDRKGEVVAKYRKTHLFNLKDESGKAIYCESDGYVPGDDIVTVELEGWNLGLAICYDLRFPEFFVELAKTKPLDLIALPAAFTEGTGKDHWEVLLRARAIEQQSYVLASNQCGEHQPGKKSFGHSMIIDPWGNKLADTGDVEGLAIASISKDRINDVRAKLPALANKRRDLY